ncbi:MAG: hypothetical protein AAFV85_26540 [Cyanobacteria bacterium J06634_6]
MGAKIGLVTGIAIASLTSTLATSASALPGQTVDEAAAWMQAHPTLRALPSERLSIRRNDTPSSRYTFHGSIFGPGGGSDQSLLVRRRRGESIQIHSEKFTLVDIVRGVNISRLEDSLRNIYGAEVFADYRRAESVIVYSPGRPEDRGTARALRSHLLQGELYGYLIEVLPNTDGTVQTGSVTVMLRENVPAIHEGLRSREIQRREFENPEEGPTVPAAGPTLQQLLRSGQE